jgi:tRNA pseudouridine65 synthase
MSRSGQLFLYQDDHLVVVDKPSGLLTHRGWARDEEVLMTVVRDALGRWVYPVHRLDRGASGALILALDPEVARLLGQAFAARTVVKRYLALVRGRPPLEGLIDHPLARRAGGERLPARTAFRRLEQLGRYALVEASPHTGRLHQIRRHLKHIACPLIGDVNYGKGEHNRLFRDRYGLHRLALHAAALGLAHPVTGESLAVQAPFPEDLAVPIERLRADLAAGALA